jgi:hypothetical protein
MGGLIDGNATARERCAVRPILAHRAETPLAFTPWAWPILSARALFDSPEDYLLGGRRRQTSTRQQQFPEIFPEDVSISCWSPPSSVGRSVFL